ncbi:MAG TPA: lytic transglycosylase domain-containing protein [Rhodanobacteraceae bacterium]|jgi:soluble lytic murein transglycosylase-like protein|nr:lytic transglycosylase domain-containing protein [Rhodanobacteraceae bacterium]
MPHPKPIRVARILAACALLLASAWAAPAAASVLYRCIGAGGETAFVSHTAGYRDCEKVGAWNTPTARPVKVSERKTTPQKRRQPSGTVLPGKPPEAVKANPAILKVTPLGDDDAIQVQKLTRPQIWQPLPVVILDSLGGRVLPQLLGLAQPAPEPAPVPRPTVPASAATAPIPLKLEVDAPRPPRRGAVYRVVQKNGAVLYTNVASLAKGPNAKMLFTYIVECYACNVHSKIDWRTVPLHLAAYGNDIRAAAKQTGVSAALLRAVIHAESGFNSRALSYKGAQGLMQLMPATAVELGVGDAFDPGQNISGGARYLAMLLRDYHGDVGLAAAAYNAGEGAVSKYGGVPPYAETQVYVKRVALLYQRYRKALAGTGSTLVAADGAG